VLFLVDAQLPPALAKALKNAGHEALHVEEVGLRHAKDAVIWNYALQQGAAIITKDEDFVDRFRRQSNGPAIVWLRIGNASSKALLLWVLPLLPALAQRIQAGDKLIELR
jgi:predicted nuclease of predicted toxin-antitoxin system